jgi:hypothetical protein
MGGSGSVSPPIITVSRFLLCISYFSRRLLRISPKGSCIVGFKSRCTREPKNGQKDPGGGKWALPRGQEAATCGAPSFPPREVPRWLLVLILFVFMKKWFFKNIGSVDIRKVPKTHNTQKHRKMFFRVKTKIKGFFRISPKTKCKICPGA